MGFGILFMGYLITYLLSLNPYAAVTRLAGYIVCLVALGNLRRHNRWFAYTHMVCIPLLAFSAGNAAIEIVSRILGERAPVGLSTATDVMEVVMTLMVLVFHACLLLAIYTIAKDTDLPRLARSARVNLVVTAGYAVLTGIWALPVELGESDGMTLNLMLFLLQLVWIFLNLFLLFRCYMWICLEGDEDMAQKPSRFAFVNRFREKQAARNQKAVDEAKTYAEEKRRPRLAANATKPKYRKTKKRK